MQLYITGNLHEKITKGPSTGCGAVGSALDLVTVRKDSQKSKQKCLCVHNIWKFQKFGSSMYTVQDVAGSSPVIPTNGIILYVQFERISRGFYEQQIEAVAKV